jgi:large subunit ribosomal protein L29
MALKAKEIREMKKEELDAKVLELRKELMKLNSQVHTGTAPKNAGQLRQIKRTIARILTIKRINKSKEESKKA